MFPLGAAYRCIPYRQQLGCITLPATSINIDDYQAMGVMAEVFAQVPFLVWIIIPAIAFGALWKVFNVLYVKPRDFRIDSLEREIEDLKSSHKQRESGEMRGSETGAGQPQANVPVKSPKHRALAPERLIVSPSEQEPDEKIALAEGLRSLAFALSRIHDENLTDLQKEAVEEYFTGKPVVWAATIKSVSNAQDGSIDVRIADGDKLFDTAIARFEDAQKQDLLKLQEGDRVLVSGTISRIFIGTPFLEQCSITKTTGTSIAQ